MSKKINPFKPQAPISPGMFIGRIPEILRLENYLFQTKNSQPSNFIITGERGIGKSSLLLYLLFIAQGKMKVEDQKMNFLVVFTDIDNSTTQLDLIRRIELKFNRELRDVERIRTFLNEAWSFLQRIEVSGTKINPKLGQLQDNLIFDNFSYAFSDTVDRITSIKDKSSNNKFYDGVVILVDEADRASPELDLGSFFKLLTERLQRNGCERVIIGLAGLPNLRDILLKSHESSLRLFDELHLDRLSNEEVNRVIDRCLEKANESSPKPVTITKEGREWLLYFSEGYPHFIQQFGHSAFDKDDDFEIGKSDVLNGALGENGALELIGDRYYRDNFYKKIQKESYRKVLRIMAEKLDSWISKKEIREKFSGKETVLNNAIQVLKERHIILPKEGERGWYRLQHKGFAHWINLKTQDPANINAIDKLNS